MDCRPHRSPPFCYDPTQRFIVRVERKDCASQNCLALGVQSMLLMAGCTFAPIALRRQEPLLPDLGEKNEVQERLKEIDRLAQHKRKLVLLKPAAMQIPHATETVLVSASRSMPVPESCPITKRRKANGRILNRRFRVVFVSIKVEAVRPQRPILVSARDRRNSS